LTDWTPILRIRPVVVKVRRLFTLGPLSGGPFSFSRTASGSDRVTCGSELPVLEIAMARPIDAITREVSEREHEGKSRLVVAATRTYATSPENLWDAITQPERLARWFAPVTGDLRLRGSFEIKGTAKGEILECLPPQQLAVTWEAFGDVSWVQVQLSPVPSGGTLLRVEHILSGRFFDRLHWSWFGAGATGLGWELWLLGLEQYLEAGSNYALPPGLSPVELQRWRAAAVGKEYLKRASDDWGRAEIDRGEKPAKARKRAARTFKFYGRDVAG
jgi:uncharacterized protein YndB with AHSA1/START domain